MSTARREVVYFRGTDEEAGVSCAINAQSSVHYAQVVWSTELGSLPVAEHARGGGAGQTYDGTTSAGGCFLFSTLQLHMRSRVVLAGDLSRAFGGDPREQDVSVVPFGVRY